MRAFCSIAILFVYILSIYSATVNVALQNPTATFSQTSYSVATTINGSYATSSEGWAISPDIVNQTAVWETVSNLTASTVQFAMHQFYGDGQHLLGKFRWSYTTADRSTFADGLISGGDVTTTWVVLTPSSITGPSGTVFTPQADGSILVSGTLANGTYYVNYAINGISNITGFRLEALEDPSLPTNGPGRAINGNFVLTELVVSAELTPVPEPSSWILACFAIVLSCIKKKK